MQKHRFICNYHPDEIITNFCCLRTCLTPLCPDCIDEHNKKHKLLGQFPEVDTLSRVKAMCHNRLVVASKTLEDQLTRLNSATNVNLDDIIKKSLNEIENLRINLINQMNSYFKSIQDEYVTKLRGSELMFNDYRGLKEEIASIIEELNAVRYSLDSPNSFESIKNTVKLDTDSLLATFDKQVEDALSKSVSLPIKFVLNEGELQNFQNGLKRIISVFSQDVKVVTNEQYLRQLKPNHNDEISSQNKSYFNSKFI